ncbi:MAG: hypothetical protein DI598_13610 [Pseudopedobacter saltans]|uniref:histidine kinase n=1 Tax=Pseudopedobacter saltans TaxID=151895 RepID=A0A2W5ERU2_9SPHI|nr:MAG: hypothetical protein DI598_13610 [Pseudopedobacter saltans]
MKNFYTKITVSIFSISILFSLAIYLFFQKYYLTAIFLISIGIIIIWNLIRYNKRIRKDILYFLQSRKNDDGIEIATNNYGMPFQLFFQTYNSIINNQKSLSEENYQLHQLLTTILNKTTTGFIVIPKTIEDNTDVLYINESAQNLLSIPQTTNWSRITAKIPQLKETLYHLSDGGKSFFSNTEGNEISIESQLIISNNQPLTLLTLQNIKTEMDTKETDSWNKLIQVMTHEILNSLTPIQTMSFILENLSKQDNLNEEEKEDMRIASATIVSRSKGLMQFVQDYRKVAALPIPQKSKIQLKFFIENIVQLFNEQIQLTNIKLDVLSDDIGVVIWADPTQIEQVLINLITNAMHAVSAQDKPHISIQTIQQMTSTQIIVKDNGKGISAEEMPQIFVPFFTTRQDGSGIGLSVVRNIMRMHNGTVTVQSSGVNQGSTFVLNFPYKY